MDQNQSIKNRQALAPYKLAITRYIRSAMALQGLKYEDLAAMLNDKGIVISADNLRSKTYKGMFSADLLVLIIDVLNIKEEALIDILKQVHND